MKLNEAFLYDYEYFYKNHPEIVPDWKILLDNNEYFLDNKQYFYENHPEIYLNYLINQIPGSFNSGNKELKVPYISQLPSMPMGCELASILMLFYHSDVRYTLNDNGDKIPITLNSIWKKIDSSRPWLHERTSDKNWNWVKNYNPNTTNGVFSILMVEQFFGPITQILNETGQDDWIPVELQDYTFNELKLVISRYNAPVIIYAGGPVASTGRGHVVVAVGFDENGVWYIDPAKGLKYKSNEDFYNSILGTKAGDDFWHEKPELDEHLRLKGGIYGFILLTQKDYEEFKHLGSTYKLVVDYDVEIYTEVKLK